MLLAMHGMLVALPDQHEVNAVTKLPNGWPVRVLEQFTREQFALMVKAQEEGRPLHKGGILALGEGGEVADIPAGVFFFRVVLLGVPYQCDVCRVIALRTAPEDGVALGDMLATHSGTTWPLRGGFSKRMCPECLRLISRHGRS